MGRYGTADLSSWADFLVGLGVGVALEGEIDHSGMMEGAVKKKSALSTAHDPEMTWMVYGGGVVFLLVVMVFWLMWKNPERREGLRMWLGIGTLILCIGSVGRYYWGMWQGVGAGVVNHAFDPQDWAITVRWVVKEAGILLLLGFLAGVMTVVSWRWR